ncbi:MAG: ABC transporter permease [Lachnospiraceae bacterium]|nr:ABC transporter permease [Lachnospiraceae bacterium]
MTFYQLAFRYLKRKKAKVILLFFILLVVSSMILSTNMILEATKDSKAAIQEKAKAKIVLEVLEENNQITTQEVKEILNLKEVSTVNCLDQAYAFPVNFYPVTGSDSTEESNQKIMLFCYDDLQNDSAFYEGRYRLTGGEPITNDKKGAVINELLADANGWKLGDFVEVQNADGKRTFLKIIGFFLSGSERKQTSQMDSVNRIENQVFVDRESYSQLFGDGGYSKVSVYCKNPEQLSLLEEQLLSILPDKVNAISSDTLYKQMALPLEQIRRATNLILILTLVMGVGIVSLLLCMWMHTRQKEAGIFISIGKSKRSIFFQILLESFLVFLTSAIGACCLGSMMAGVLQKALTHSETAEVSLNVFLQGKEIGSLMVLGSFLILTSVTISLLPVLKTNPKDILSRMEG